MVGADGLLPLPWLAESLKHILATQRAHALLLHGPQGIGQFELSLTLAQAWLCEALPHNGPNMARPCGVCASCRLVQAHSHPDLLVLVPEALRESTGWGAQADDASTDKVSKAKPSKEIKVDAVRGAVGFSQSTASRGRGKVVLIHPAERMNAIAANSLLKTLEEPPGDARFILSCAAPEALLPTIRSRCQAVALELPASSVACEWLAQCGVVDPAVILAAAGGQPQLALEWTQQGIDAALWTRLPAMVQRGESAVFAAWPLPRLIDALQKLCHDVASVAAGAAPRYFPVASLAAVGARGEITALTNWMRELNRCARHAEHPWNAGLLAESLVQQGQHALAVPTRSPPPGMRKLSVNSSE